MEIVPFTSKDGNVTFKDFTNVCVGGCLCVSVWRAVVFKWNLNLGIAEIQSYDKKGYMVENGTRLCYRVVE